MTKRLKKFNTPSYIIILITEAPSELTSLKGLSEDHVRVRQDDK